MAAFSPSTATTVAGSSRAPKTAAEQMDTSASKALQAMKMLSENPNNQDPSMTKAMKNLQSLKRSLAEVVQEQGVPQRIFLGYIQNELDNEKNCMELPLTILLLLSFSVLAMSLLRQERIYSVEQAIEFDLRENANFAFAHNFGHKDIEDVNSFSDFWSWSRIGLLPLVVQPKWYYSETYPEALGYPVYRDYNAEELPSQWLFDGYEKPAPILNDYLRFNKLVGGIRIAQEVADESSAGECQFPTSLERAPLEAWLGKPCMPSDLALLTPERVETEVFSKFKHRQWLLPELDSLDEMRRVLLDMEDGCTHSGRQNCRCDACKAHAPMVPWLTEETRRVQLAFIIYNPSYGLYSYVGINFFFNRAGHIHKQINVMTVWTEAMGRTLSDIIVVYLSGTLWLISQIYNIVHIFKDIYNELRASKEIWYVALREEYISAWAVVDWVSVSIGVTAIIYFSRMRLAVESTNLAMVDMIDASLHKTGDKQAYLAAMEAFFALAEDMCLKEKEFRVCLYLYPNIMMMRLFKSFAAQPRLAIVTATIQRASVDLLHFLIVFVAVFVCMMVNSVLFFGQDLENFSTIPRAFHYCFLAMFGDWDWDALKGVGYFKAQIWFWLFLVINILILMNMLLAIIMDAYTAEKNKAGSAETLWEQSWQMRRRRLEFLAKERVRLNDIRDFFLQEADMDEKAMLKSDRLIKPSFLLDHVPRIQFKQANRLLVKSLEFQMKVQTADITDEDIKEDIKTNIHRVDKRAIAITEDARSIANVINHYDCMEVPGDREYDVHFGYERPEEEAKSQQTQSVENEVNLLSSEIGGVVAQGLKRIECWQENFEQQQSTMHAVITELQHMVTQEADCLASVAEVLGHLAIINGCSTVPNDVPRSSSGTKGHMRMGLAD